MSIIAKSAAAAIAMIKVRVAAHRNNGRKADVEQAAAQAAGLLWGPTPTAAVSIEVAKKIRSFASMYDSCYVPVAA